MSFRFPPSSSHDDRIKQFLEILATAIRDRSAIYVSAPITSGKRYFQLNSNAQLKSDEIRKANREFVRSFLISVHEHYPSKVVFDPTALDDLLNWTQDDYRYLWGKIIEKFVEKVILVNDWQFSNGCAYEFLVAHKHGVETLSESFQILPLEKGMELICNAIHTLKQADIATSFLEKVHKELSKITCTTVK